MHTFETTGRIGNLAVKVNSEMFTIVVALSRTRHVDSAMAAASSLSNRQGRIEKERTLCRRNLRQVLSAGELLHSFERLFLPASDAAGSSSKR